ncbi:hypothetical protein L0337_08720 [candidate division KSB1 bacterium]|nr:hypothetical protein [candidate division KSB1 bacterium]
MKKIIVFTFTLLISRSVYGQEQSSVLQCKCNEKINKDYVFLLSDTIKDFKEKKWLPIKTVSREVMNQELILRDKIFAKLDSKTPIIKSITPPHGYFPEGEITEFEGSLIHRSGSILMIKWENPSANKVWIATINLEQKKAIITESYEGLTSFGINIEILDCK